MDNFIKNMSAEDYHKKPAISSSSLKAMLSSPALCRYRLDNEVKSTDAMLLGAAVHTAFLEPKKFIAEYEFSEKKSKGEIVPYLCHEEGEISPKQFEKFEAMVVALENNKEAQALIKNKLTVEGSFFTEYMGVKLKVRADLIVKDGWIVDLKTVGGMKEKPSSPDNFNNDFFDKGYDVQMFMYKKVIEATTGKQFKGFKFLCVDSKTPISAVNIYTFVEGESKWFEIGGHRFHTALELYKKCTKTGVWFANDEIEHDDLELSYKAAEYYANICEGE